jgi:hypothetical protein
MNKIIKYRIKRISRLVYNLEKKENFKILGEDCEINTHLALKFVIPESEIGLVLNITYTDKRDRQKLLYFSVEVIFHVDNYNESFNVNGTNVSIPDNFFGDMISVSLGAARGMLVELNHGTYLEMTYLPIFNTADILAGIKQSQISKATQQP